MNNKKINIFEDERFIKKYKNANYELKKPENEFVFKLLINTYNDEEQIKFIKMANDYLKLAPVYSWLMYNSEALNKKYASDTKQKGKKELISDNLKKAIGSFWGFVMQTDEKNNKSIINNKKYIQHPVKQSLKRKNTFGFMTATLYDISD